jgi:hypothetical protein
MASTRPISSIPPPPSTEQMSTTAATPEKEWPVRVYRQVTQADGSMSWERMIAKNAANRTVLVKATPRLSCIVLRRLQIRVRLSAASEPSLRMMVTRRKDRILIASNQRLRVLMLKFRSIQECLAFSDQLVALNPAAVVVCPAQQQPAVEPNNQVAFYISRLLHDPEFASFCRRLESSLVASQDGLKALQALAQEEEESTTKTNPHLPNENGKEIE